MITIAQVKLVFNIAAALVGTGFSWLVLEEELELSVLDVSALTELFVDVVVEFDDLGFTKLGVDVLPLDRVVGVDVLALDRVVGVGVPALERVVGVGDVEFV